MTKFRDSSLGPAVILCVVCLVITLALSLTHKMTLPIIETSTAKAADNTRMLLLPTGDSFTKLDNISLPDGVVDAYAADNGSGYVFTSQAKGFNGTVSYMIGIDSGGNVVGINLFQHEETPGLGTQIGEEDYLSKYFGSVDPYTVDAVTGATRTSDSLKNSIKQAYEAFVIVGGG